MRGLELHRPHAVVLDPDRSGANFGVFTAQPFERGWGVTVGNALRRILLSSIEGSAITAVRLAGVDHEYDSIPGVMEDVTDLILNMKRVPLRLSGVETIDGPAQDGESPGCSRPRLSRAGPNWRSSILRSISRRSPRRAPSTPSWSSSAAGATSRPMSTTAKDLGVGYIYLDAAFSPVRKANFRIEPARVGQATDYEKLVLEVWTNGAITPAAAVSEAAQLLADHLPIFTTLEAGETAGTPAQERRTPRQTRSRTWISAVGSTNMLRNAEIETRPGPGIARRGRAPGRLRTSARRLLPRSRRRSRRSDSRPRDAVRPAAIARERSHATHEIRTQAGAGV